MHRYPVLFTTIDGKFEDRESISLPAGDHTLRMISRKPATQRIIEEKELTLNLLPCRTYYISAQHPNSIDDHWEPVIKHDTNRKGCPENN